jgi:hypothetical protein
MLRTLTHLMIASALVLASTAGHAALGEKPSTLAGTANHPAAPAMARRLSANASVAASLYTIQETQLESSTVVREYTTPAGVVFAITWQGPVLPNLQTLLGNYFPTFEQETTRAQQTGHQRTRVLMQTPGLVVQSTGRMGRFKGHAYAPDLVPQGVDVQGLLP